MSLKNLAIFMAVYGIAFIETQGEVKNGYEPEINGMRNSLKALTTLLNEENDFSIYQRATMKNKINKLVEYISYYELTETLLHQFREIAPEIYDEIEVLKDGSGQSVTVFVKFVSELEMQHGAAGTTNLNHIETDKSIYLSEYGLRTVSIKIASVTKSLTLLAHEFGHVNHQVTNLVSYVEYYSTHYQNENFKSKFIGHNSNDPSGQKAIEFENRFRERYMDFLKSGMPKSGNPLALLQTIKKNIYSGESNF